MTSPTPTNEKHRGATLAKRPHWRLPLGALTFDALAILAGVGAEASALYVRGAPAQTLPSDLRTALEPLRDWNSTTIPAGTGWPTDWYAMLRLREPGRALTLLQEHGVPATFGVVGVWLFRADELLAEWQAEGGVLRLAPALGELRIRRLTKLLGQAAELIVPAV